MRNFVRVLSHRLNLLMFKMSYSLMSMYFHKLMSSIIKFPKCFIFWPLTIVFIISYPSISQYISNPGIIRWNDFTIGKVTSIPDLNITQLNNDINLSIHQVWLSSADSNVLSPEFLNMSLSIQNDHLLQGIPNSHIYSERCAFKHNENLFEDGTVYVYSLFSYLNSARFGKKTSEDKYDHLLSISKKLFAETPVPAENFLGGITRVNGIVMKAKVLKLLLMYRELPNKSHISIQKKVRKNIDNYMSSALRDENSQIRLFWNAPDEANLLLKNNTINLKIQKMTIFNKFILCLIVIVLLIYATVAFFSLDTFKFKIGLFIGYIAQLFFTVFASISVTSYLTKSVYYLEIPVEFLIAPLLFGSCEIMFRLLSPAIILKDNDNRSDKFLQLVIITSIKSGAVVFLELFLVFSLAYLQNRSQAFSKGFQYCLFVGISLLINYCLHITFFVCILCVDLVGYEPFEILNTRKVKFKFFLKRQVDDSKIICSNQGKLSKRLYSKVYQIKENLRHHLLRILLLVKLPLFNNLCYEIVFMITIVYICLNWSRHGINFNFFSSSNYEYSPETKLEFFMNIESLFNPYNVNAIAKAFHTSSVGSYNFIFSVPEIMIFSKKDYSIAVPATHELKELLCNYSSYNIYSLMEFLTILTFMISALIIVIKFCSKDLQAVIQNANSFVFLKNSISVPAMYNIDVTKSLNNIMFPKSSSDYLYHKLSSLDFNSKIASVNGLFNEKFSTVSLESENLSSDIIKIASNKICPFIVSISLDRQVLIWSPTVSPLPSPMRLPVPNNLWPITHSIISMHGNFIAVFSRSGVVKVWSRFKMDWIKTVSIPELKNVVPLESFFRKKTVLGKLKDRQKKGSVNSNIDNESKNKVKKDAKHIKSRRSSASSVSSINTNNDYKKVTLNQSLNFSNMTELLLVLKSGKMFTIDCSSNSLEDEDLEVKDVYNKESKQREYISKISEESEGFVITTISKEPLVTSNILISSRVNDRLVSATKDGKIIVATVVNNKWRIRTLFVQENKYNSGKVLMTPLAIQKRQISMSMPNNLYSASKANSMKQGSTSSVAKAAHPDDTKVESKNNSVLSIFSSVPIEKTTISNDVIDDDLLKSVIVPVAFVGMIVKTRGLIADLIDVQTGILVKQFHIAQFKSGTFRIFHDQPTHCKFCGCASISSFSIAYTESDSNTLILHTFSNEGRAKNSICLRVERDPRETRCLGFDAVNEQQHWLTDVKVWNLTDLNMIEGVIIKQPETQTSNKSSAFHRYLNGHMTRSRTESKKWRPRQYNISSLWKGFTMSANGVVNYHEIPEDGSHGLIVKNLKIAARFGHKGIIVPFGNIMKILYLGNDELIITSNLDEDGNSNQKVSGLSFVSKRRMRHIELINSKNFTDLPTVEP